MTELELLKVIVHVAAALGLPAWGAVVGLLVTFALLLAGTVWLFGKERVAAFLAARIAARARARPLRAPPQ